MSEPLRLHTFTTFLREYQLNISRTAPLYQPDEVSVAFNRIDGILTQAYHLLDRREIRKDANRHKEPGDLWNYEGHSQFLIPNEFPLAIAYLEATRDCKMGRVLLGVNHLFGVDKRFPLLEEVAKRFELTANKPFIDNDGGSGIVELLKKSYGTER